MVTAAVAYCLSLADDIQPPRSRGRNMTLQISALDAAPTLLSTLKRLMELIGRVTGFRAQNSILRCSTASPAFLSGTTDVEPDWSVRRSAC